jgi:hypothetical protein
MTRDEESAGTSDESIQSQGVIDYFHSQSELMLSQYENINRLLGPTTDWTHPGMLCEELLRGFLRKMLVAGVSADKGYVLGRTSLGGASLHSPEIDIQIHDTRKYRPLFQMGELVIVYPQSVLGMIQVKRTLSSSVVAKGIKNVIMAKHFLHSVLSKNKLDGPQFDRLVFAAVVGFDDELDDQSKARDRHSLPFRKWYKALSQNHGLTHETALAMLPDFVGALRSQYTMRPMAEKYMGEWYTLKAVVKSRFVVLQNLAGMLNIRIAQRLGLKPDEIPASDMPYEPRHLFAFKIDKP